jgi:hypothetical protein
MNWYRAKEIAKFKKACNVVTGFMRAYPNVGYRYLIKPMEALEHEYNLVDFNPERSKRIIETGRQAAKDALAKAESAVFNELN